jgi:Mlc titration factor MtfA (ptsG expression regulator)
MHDVILWIRPIAVLLVISGLCLGFWGWKRRRRQAVLNRPFPTAWLNILEQRAPFYTPLSSDERHRLQDLIRIFIADKKFEGCGGQAMTEEIRITIAAQACRLLLHRDIDRPIGQTKVYPGLYSILVYPSHYNTHSQQHEGRVITENYQSRWGESWNRGAVVLAWDAIEGASHILGEGHNLVLHEFAHQLDVQSGEADGVPLLQGRLRHAAWAHAMSDAYRDLQSRVNKGKSSVLDTYGATSPAEFFAVATECFFEKPLALKGRYAELYEQLQLFYGNDPSSNSHTGGPFHVL